jgi:hypothetical protein
MDLEGRYVFSFLKATKNGKKGMVDKTGKVHIDFLYDDLIGVRKISYIAVETFNKFIIAVKNNKYGVIGRNGEEVLPFVYDDLQYMTAYQLIASKNGKYGLIDLNNNNNVLLPFEFQFICYKSGNIIAYKDSYEKYYYDGYKISKMNN